MGLLPHRSTSDRIATLRMILQTRREFRRPTWMAYVDFRAAFDSDNRQSLWLLLKTKGVPQKLIDLLGDLYTNTVSCVRVDGQVSDWFFDICRGAPRFCGCTRLVFGTNRLDSQSFRSPRLRGCEPGSGSVHRSGLC